ncbi:universal stress protein [Actinoallomurus rhizosphaericola]|uniref:universal stress protein n=1 Tax=Actinoallomurus rhizosphaericola TaxID=2952536 RepID=UPI002092A4F0|nr:universal stress protein [Actinoallomurus rhizosphaericola]MCO5995593.1 universal stress protein [Actinoallomurus rhizosphaericola]
MTGSTSSSAEPAPILVGIDESPARTAALRWAVGQARRQGCRLRIVHAWELGPGEAAVLSHDEREQRRKSVVADCRASIERVLGRAAPDVAADIEILEGPAGPILVELARNASLLVLATHDRPGRRRLTAQSVGHYCLSYASCPVVMVPGKPEDTDPQTGG